MTARRSIRPFLPYIVLSAIHLVLLSTGPSWAITSTKALLMPALAAAVLVAVRPRRGAPLVLLVAALAFSWAGDVLLSVDGWFVPGLLAFLLAHVAYLALFLRLPRGGRRLVTPWAAVYAVWYVGFLLLLAPHLGALLGPVAVYGFVLGAMAALAAARGGVIAAGGALFVVSDTVLALGRFLPGYEFALHDLTVMATYLAAQGLIACGVVKALRAGARSTREPGRPAPATAP